MCLSKNMDASTWMMLDRFVFHRDDEEESSPFLAESIASSKASACTSLGRRFDILLLRTDDQDWPLCLSRLYMRWPDGTKSEDAKGTEIVAAHHDLVLFRQTSFGGLGKDGHLGITQDHFVCISSLKPCLQLKLLPVCDKPMIYPFGEGEEKEVNEQRVFLSDTVGLARDGDKFAVAQLALISTIRGTLMMEAQVCVLRSHLSDNDGDGKWEARRIPIQHKENEYKELWYWSTDAVITFNKSICWINYYRGGMLVCDVFEENPKILYLRLPIVDRPRSSAQGKAFYEVNRSVCATTDIRDMTDRSQVLMFTDVIRSDGELFGPLREGSGFTIHSYKLSSLHGSWVKHVTITSEELSASNHFVYLRPGILMYPTVSMLDFDIACFLFSEYAEEENSKVSFVTIILSTKTVISVRPYISREKCRLSGNDDLFEEKSHLLRSFISSMFRFPVLKTGTYSSASAEIEEEGDALHLPTERSWR